MRFIQQQQKNSFSYYAERFQTFCKTFRSKILTILIKVCLFLDRINLLVEFSTDKCFVLTRNIQQEMLDVVGYFPHKVRMFEK